MTLNIDVTINGERYTQRQLARFQYERALHVLHELKELGAKLFDGERELSHRDLNWLDPERAQQISLDYRDGLGPDGTAKLFGDVLRDSDARWKEFNETYIEGQINTGQTDFAVSGVAWADLITSLGGGQYRDSLAVMPEHYIITGAVHTGQRVMETFGMFGEPTDTQFGSPSAEPPASFPFRRDPYFPVGMFAQMKLNRDSTPINVGAMHQIKPSTDGFELQSIFYCPGSAPQRSPTGTPCTSQSRSQTPARSAIRKRPIGPRATPIRTSITPSPLVCHPTRSVHKGRKVRAAGADRQKPTVPANFRFPPSCDLRNVC